MSQGTAGEWAAECNLRGRLFVAWVSNPWSRRGERRPYSADISKSAAFFFGYSLRSSSIGCADAPGYTSPRASRPCHMLVSRLLNRNELVRVIALQMPLELVIVALVVEDRAQLDV